MNDIEWPEEQPAKKKGKKTRTKERRDDETLTVAQMIEEAIIDMNEPKGSSYDDIKSYIDRQYVVDVHTIGLQISNTLARGCKVGEYRRTKANKYMLTSDAERDRKVKRRSQVNRKKNDQKERQLYSLCD